MRVQGRDSREIETDDYDIESVNRTLNQLIAEIEILHARERVSGGWR